MKGIAIWVLAVLTGLFIAGLAMYNLLIKPPLLPIGVNVPGAVPGGEVSGKLPEGAARNPIDIGSEAVNNIPWNDVKDYFLGGLFGVITFLSKYIIRPGIEFIASTITQSRVVIPEILGYVVTGILILMIFWKLWGRIWEFVSENWVRIMWIFAFVFTAGIVLLYLGLI